MSEKRKKDAAVRTVLIVSVAVISTLLLIIGAAAFYLRSVYKTSYSTDVPIEERTDVYSVDVVSAPDVVETVDRIVTDGGTDTDEHGMQTYADTSNDVSTDEITDTAVTDAAETAAGDEYVGKIPIYKVEPHDPDTENYLFIGRDEGTYYGRADSAMIFSYNKSNNSVRIVSLLRDSYVPIEGHNWNKLGHALSYGGVGLYINTVNYVLDLDVQKYFIVDFAGVKSIVDSVSGVDILLTSEEAAHYSAKWGEDIPAGIYRMDGEKALEFARNRSLAGTDFARAQRQRRVLIAVFERLKSSDPGKALKAVKTMLGYLKTNVSANEVLDIAAKVFSAGGSPDVRNTQMPFDDTWSYAYVKPPGYTGNIAVTVFDIPENREKIREFLYVR